jgi:basic membrane protein A
MLFVSVLVAADLALTACGGGGSKSASSGSSLGAKSLVKVGLAYDVGGRGDKSLNDSAAAGLDRAKSEFGIELKELSADKGETDADKEQRLRLLAQGGYDPVVGIGFSYASALDKIAKEFPDTKFAIVDDPTAGSNITNLVFAEDQGSFLVGAAAALKSKGGNVGYIGGCQVPLWQKYETGFTAGAKAVNPSIKVQVKYLSTPPTCSGINNLASSTAAANGMYDSGADIVFAAASGSDTGVFQAAKAKSKKAIGVNIDRYQSASADLQPTIVTSMLKKADVAVYEYVKSVVAGSPLTGIQTIDLKRDGVGYATSGGQVDDIKAKLGDYRQQIIDGKITVPDVPAK